MSVVSCCLCWLQCGSTRKSSFFQWLQSFILLPSNVSIFGNNCCFHLLVWRMSNHDHVMENHSPYLNILTKLPAVCSMRSPQHCLPPQIEDRSYCLPLMKRVYQLWGLVEEKHWCALSYNLSALVDHQHTLILHGPMSWLSPTTTACVLFTL